MVRLISAVLMIPGMALAQASLPAPQPAQSSIPAQHSTSPMPELPPQPQGRATVIGGQIVSVNPVLDEFTLKVFGGGNFKIIYDARTRVFVNGNRISTVDLQPEDHASVETTLDGTKVYALDVHILSQLPQGESEGQVIEYNPHTEELKINGTLTRRPIKLHVAPNTPVTGTGQAAGPSSELSLSSLRRGTLVNVKFQAGSAGQANATQINVLATPGASYIFTGKISYLDIHAGRMVITDPTDNQNYQVYFTPSDFPTVRRMHEGTPVKVTTDFSGSRYVATAIQAE